MFEKVKAIIEEHVDCTGVEITPETELLADLPINSLDLVEMVCAFEVAFDIVVPEKDIRKFSRVKDVLGYLERVLNP
jgi:acyl carrier protein